VLFPQSLFIWSILDMLTPLGISFGGLWLALNFILYYTAKEGYRDRLATRIRNVRDNRTDKTYQK
jgi:hypothetical protein